MEREASGDERKPQKKKRTGTSKYDFVKVRVWLGGKLNSHYVLSRFLISRMLTVTKIPHNKVRDPSKYIRFHAFWVQYVPIS